MITENPAVDPAPPTPDAPRDWRRLHALGLPAGSVRALLAVLIFGATWGLLVARPSREVPDYLRDLLFIIMGHYFASRRRADESPEPGPPPLYLPRGTVRVVLVLGCVATAAWLFRGSQLTDPVKNPGVVTLILVGGFLLGVVLRSAGTLWRGAGSRPPRWVEDARAVLSIGAAVLLLALVWNRVAPVVPPDGIDAAFGRVIHMGRFGPENALAAVVGFYFGSRS